MVAFNKTLVAKQVWRVVQNPDSLMARILKARYFKHSDIMEAGLGSNPSFVWRSLLWGRALLSKGLCWRVGTGEKISAKLDPWIPGLSSFRCNNNTLLDGNLKVASFISPNGSWYDSIIRQIFSTPEAEAILDIPLNRRGCTDIRYWHGSSNGKYSVRDGYRLEANSFAPPPSQSSHSLLSWWKVIWQLQEEFEVFATVSWAIWSDLCKLLHAPKLLPVAIDVGWAFSLLGAFRMASESCKMLPMQEQISADSLWKRPNVGQVRLDLDAGWDEANNIFSVGAVIRDSQGLLLGAKAKLVRNRGSIKGAELEAIRFGMDYCVAQQFANVCIFSDSLQAVHAVSKPEEELGSVGALALEIHFMLHEHNFLLIHHMKRSANGVAHLLAHKALIWLSNLDWVSCGFPTWLLKAVEHDLSLTS
ncbi:uncharacterized protein [Primulina eburnea]|uniref:uncharacterized protein n=1 Tax=Primulina eburnea TaxID=1245227 RepID=UPI003C6C2F67